MSQYRRNSSTWYTADEAGLGTLEGKESFGIELLAAPVSTETTIGVSLRAALHLLETSQVSETL